MPPPGPIAGRGDWLAVLRILLLVQGAIAFVATAEVLVVGIATGGVLAPLAVVNLIGAVVTLRMASQIGFGSRRTRKITVLLQVGWLLFAAIDLALALFITQRGLELVPLLTRVVLPLTIFRMLRTQRARDLFGVGPSRRQRRKAKKAPRVAARISA